MTNDEISGQLSLLSRLMEVHGENEFKARSYATAAFQIDRTAAALSGLEAEQIFAIKGIGPAIGAKILQLLHDGIFPLLEDYLARTPQGILQMLQIKGLGPRKIHTIWKELGIESLGELLYACEENRLMIARGFGAKTQEAIRQSLEFFLEHQGSFLYAEVEELGPRLLERLHSWAPDRRWELTGDFRRVLETIDCIELITDAPREPVRLFLQQEGHTLVQDEEQFLEFRTQDPIRVRIHFSNPEDFFRNLWLTTGSPEYIKDFLTDHPLGPGAFQDEEDIFARAGMPWIPAYRRELPEGGAWKDPDIPEQSFSKEDIRGIIHAHSRWSDGSNTLEEMALACRSRGFQYLVISDHSASAFYANGLNPQRVFEQHREVDELNCKLAPFRIFKSIESDILPDGSLDYSSEVLQTFDLVIASIHSNLKMSREKATSRLIRAVENPFTRILGHPSGRLLLSRPAYPIDYPALIGACASNRVVLELNAHPRRLDLDWNWIPHALERKVLISVDPDAHNLEGINHIHYGILAGRKGGLGPLQNLSSFSLIEFEDFLQRNRRC